MNVTIAGAGRLGDRAAHLLAATGHQVTVIDRDQSRLDRLTDLTVVRRVHGDACEPAVLEAAGILTTNLLLAATGEDEDNLVIALLAKRQFDVPRVFARVNDPDDTWLFDGRWGVDVALPAATPLVSLIDEATGGADTIGLLRLAADGVTLVETHVNAGSTAADRTLADIPLPPSTVVATVIRSGQPTVPTSDFRFQTGDTLLVVTTNATEQEIHAAFHRDQS
ncbi:MAG TPA: NAD-binding protein [Mycobacteriales bacterium]|nr:NAD-binding protein [Mycobacteriales bacterium]